MKKSKLFLSAVLLCILTLLPGCAAVSEKIESIELTDVAKVSASIALRTVTVKFLGEQADPTEAANKISSAMDRAIEELTNDDSVLVTVLHAEYANLMDELPLLEIERTYADSLALAIYQGIAGDVGDGTLSPEAAIKVVNALKVIKSAASAYL